MLLFVVYFVAVYTASDGKGGLAILRFNSKVSIKGRPGMIMPQTFRKEVGKEPEFCFIIKDGTNAGFYKKTSEITIDGQWEKSDFTHGWGWSDRAVPIIKDRVRK